MIPELIGKPLPRKEDPEILRGEARYISDVSAVGMLYAKVVRSPMAHARILSIDKNQALELEGVEAVFDAQDLGSAQRHLGSFGQFPPPILEKWNPRICPAPVTTLAKDKVRYVGEPVAIVIARDKYLAEDAMELVDVDYEPLDAVTQVEQALREDAPLLHETDECLEVMKNEPWRSWCSSKNQWSKSGEYQERWDRNTALDMNVSIGDADAEFDRAAHVVTEHYASHRYTGVPLEGRGILAIPDSEGLGMMVWSSHQIPYFHRALIAESLDIPVDEIRVAQPYLGGGFGPKAGIYGEDVLIPFAAKTLNRPVKWLEDKREHLQASSHSREQQFDAEMALDEEGRILGIRYSVLLDVGAFLTFPVVLPYLGMCHVLGPYRVPSFGARIRSVFTNKASAAPYRGAGRPEVAFVLNRLMDHAAKKLGMDPVELRHKNLIQPEEIPYEAGILYRDGSPMILDSGDYPKALEKCLTEIDYNSFRNRQSELWKEQRYLGIGLSCNIEAGGLGPTEGARVEVTASGGVRVHLGVVDTGQGHRTSFAQICAGVLGVDIERIEVRSGDTRGVIYSRGTYHSRAAILAGNAVYSAAKKVRSKIVEFVANKLGVDPDALECVDNSIRSTTEPERAMTFDQVAKLCVPDGSSIQAAVASAGSIVSLPEGVTPGLDASSFETGTSVVWGSATHATIVEVDPELGTFEIQRYVVAHDCGRPLNSMIVDGQVHGGTAQGISGTYLEQLVYDEEGQLLTSTMADYMLPRMSDIPKIETFSIESPTPNNSLGVKGAGEGGTIGPPAALAAAIEDALQPFNVKITKTPLAPKDVLEAIRAGAS